MSQRTAGILPHLTDRPVPGRSWEQRSREVRALSHDSSLEPLLRAVEPAVRLIPERYLRQVLHYLIDWGHLLPTNPNQPYWVTRSDLDACDILPPQLLSGTEPELLLLTDPEDRMIERLPVDMQLRDYWRVLFQAAVMREIDRKAAAGLLTELACLERLERFGLAAARELRAVLIAEHLIAPEVDAVGLYRTFAAVYLDLDAFDSHAVEHYFPSLPHGDAVRSALQADVDAAGAPRANAAGGIGRCPNRIPPG